MKYCTEHSAKHVQYKKITTQFSCARMHLTAWNCCLGSHKDHDVYVVVVKPVGHWVGFTRLSFWSKTWGVSKQRRSVHFTMSWLVWLWEFFNCFMFGKNSQFAVAILCTNCVQIYLMIFCFHLSHSCIRERLHGRSEYCFIDLSADSFSL